MKKKIALLLVACLTVSALTMACSKKDDGKETTKKAQETTTEAPSTEETTTEAPASEYKVVTEASTDAYSFGNEDKTSAFWTAFSNYYKLSGDGKLVLDTTVKGGAGNYNNFVVVAATAERDTTDYKEYAVVRPDNWGWGGGDNMSVSGNAIEYTKTFDSFDTLSPSFAETTNDSNIKVTIEKKGEVITYTFDIAGTNKETLQTTAKVTEATNNDVFFFLSADGSYVTVNSVSFE